jgi:ankyrin repeat protein
MKAEDFFTNQNEIEFAHAIEWGDRGKIQKLLDNGVNINLKGSRDEMNFLMWSLIKQNKTSYQYLLEHKADPNQMTFPGIQKEKISVMNEAVIPEDTFWLKLALEHGGNPNTEEGNDSIIFEAIRQERIENVKLLIESGANINYQNKISKDTPLIDAVIGDDYNIACYLVEKGADPLKKRVSGRTVLEFITNGSPVTSFKGPEDIKKKIEYKKKLVKKLQEKGILKDYEVEEDGVYFSK